MGSARPPRVLSERAGKWLLTLYPPFLFGRIRVLSIGAGFRSCRVRVAKSLLTRNLNGTTFGGSIFSAADPFYALMYWQIFAQRGMRVQAWLRRARIEYKKPASTALTLDFALSDEDVEAAVHGVEEAGRFSCWHSTPAVDTHGRTCAIIETEVYLRAPRRDRREVPAF